MVITGSLDPVWVRPLASLRRKGIASVVVTLDQVEFRRVADATSAYRAAAPTPADLGLATSLAQRERALFHTLAEFQIQSYRVVPGQSLGDQLVS